MADFIGKEAILDRTTGCSEKATTTNSSADVELAQPQVKSLVCLENRKGGGFAAFGKTVHKSNSLVALSMHR